MKSAHVAIHHMTRVRVTPAQSNPSVLTPVYAFHTHITPALVSFACVNHAHGSILSLLLFFDPRSQVYWLRNLCSWSLTFSMVTFGRSLEIKEHRWITRIKHIAYNSSLSNLFEKT